GSSEHSMRMRLSKACCQRRLQRPTWLRPRPTSLAMSWLSTPEKASRMMVARCTRRLAFVEAVLNLRSTFSCRSLSTTFAAEPAMTTLLAFPHLGKSAESSKTGHPVRGRFRFLGLVTGQGRPPGAQTGRLGGERRLARTRTGRFLHF